MNIEGGDMRVRMTKKMLIGAFLQLRREKPLRRITVSELCQCAGVGRGTFYAHYEDVYDLNETYTIDPAEFCSMGKSTPFTGWEVSGRCKLTMYKGIPVWEENLDSRKTTIL